MDWCTVKNAGYFVCCSSLLKYKLFNLQICILITGLLAGDATWQLSKLSAWVKKVHFS